MSISVCIDARMAHSSGIGTCIRQLIPLLSASYFRIILLVAQKETSLWCGNAEQILFPAPIYSIREQWEFSQKIPRCDIFWSPHYNIPLLPIRANKRVVTIHDACHLALGQLLSPAERLYARIVMRRAVHQSDCVVTDSLFSREELLRYLGYSGAHVITPAVCRDQFRRIGDQKLLDRLRGAYRLPARFALFVGNQKPHKNLSSLLRAFSKMSIPNFGLVIVGRRQGLRNCESFEELAEHPSILFLEGISDDDLVALYSLAEMFVFPSLYEGFGLPPLEAMSCGCPTIVSRRASLPEVCGDASIYIDPNHPWEIAQAMTRMLSDDECRKQCIQKGFARVALFSWKETAQSYCSLFEQLLM